MLLRVCDDFFHLSKIIIIPPRYSMWRLLSLIVLLQLFLLSAQSEEADDGTCGCMPARGSTGVGTAEAVRKVEEEKGGNAKESTCKMDTDGCDSTLYSRQLLTADSRTSFIDGGLFWMGTDKSKFSLDGETPRRWVRVNSFHMDTFEVTNEDFSAFAQNTSFRTDSEIYDWSFVFHSAVPARVKKGLEQAVLGAEWWLQGVFLFTHLTSCTHTHD